MAWQIQYPHNLSTSERANFHQLVYQLFPLRQSRFQSYCNANWRLTTSKSFLLRSTLWVSPIHAYKLRGLGGAYHRNVGIHTGRSTHTSSGTASTSQPRSCTSSCMLLLSVAITEVLHAINSSRAMLNPSPKLIPVRDTSLVRKKFKRAAHLISFGVATQTQR
jgi:hypothetical protein